MNTIYYALTIHTTYFKHIERGTFAVRIVFGRSSVVASWKQFTPAHLTERWKLSDRNFRLCYWTHIFTHYTRTNSFSSFKYNQRYDCRESILRAIDNKFRCEYTQISNICFNLGDQLIFLSATHSGTHYHILSSSSKWINLNHKNKHLISIIWSKCVPC